MRVGILTTQCPFVVGGAELHARALEEEFRRAGHEAEIISMPFKWYPSKAVLDHMVAARALDVSSFNGEDIDIAIGLKFPAYFMRHPDKRYWILHQHRQAYDLWATGQTDLFDDDDGRMVRDAIYAADDVELRSGGLVFANSANVAKRLKTFNHIEAKPLYHPPPLATHLIRGDDHGYLFYPSRIAPAKRQELVLRALAEAPGVRLVFSGVPDNRAYGDELRRLSVELDVADRVTWKGFVSDEELIALYAHARAVVFVPFDEDLGYIALEAMLAGKPLITLRDAGEPATLITDGEEGLITTPDASSLARALLSLWNDPAYARKLGRAARHRYEAMNISWDDVIARLTVPRGRAPAFPPHPPALNTTKPAPDASAYQQPSIERLTELYAFKEHIAEHGAYYATHWARYGATLDLLARQRLTPLRILEIGSSPPYVFTALLRSLFPRAAFTVVQEAPAGVHTRSIIKAMPGGGRQDIELDVVAVNVETTALPFEAARFDLVIATEILEHLAIDPSYFFSEARRVLTDGGLFLVTTPNMISLRCLQASLGGSSPYSFGLFVPWNGVYGRHNREYTPFEVEALGTFCGFETAHLETRDVYDGGDPDPRLLAFMKAHGFPLDHRKQNIFYIGRKQAAEPGPSGHPPSLFPADPTIFSGELRLEGRGPDYVLRIRNTSRHKWSAIGPSRVTIKVDRRHQSGSLEREVETLSLPGDLHPGQQSSLKILEQTAGGPERFFFELSLHLDGAGPFTGTGRMHPVIVFARGIERVAQG